MTSDTFHICWTMDCESCRPGIQDPELGRNAMEGFAGLLEQNGCRGTLFLIPEEIAQHRHLLLELASRGHELGIHLHPQASGYASDFLGSFSEEMQREILERGIAEFVDHLGIRPQSCRPGYCSANDATFRVLRQAGMRQSSASIPGRRMTELASNWAGARLFVHYANPENRFLTGGLDLVELPVSVDWESMIWGGRHPQDLRVEYTDAKNHGFLIRKIMERQIEDRIPLRSLVILTHNLFRYSDVADFRRETMAGMLRTIREFTAELQTESTGSTILEAAEAYRAAVPLESS